MWINTYIEKYGTENERYGDREVKRRENDVWTRNSAIGGLEFELRYEMTWNWADTSWIGLYGWIWVKCVLGLNLGEENGIWALGLENDRSKQRIEWNWSLVYRIGVKFAEYVTGGVVKVSKNFGFNWSVFGWFGHFTKHVMCGDLGFRWKDYLRWWNPPEGAKNLQGIQWSTRAHNHALGFIRFTQEFEIGTRGGKEFTD
jgi:hypothetical protein